jgi:hypothetical protein
MRPTLYRALFREAQCFERNLFKHKMVFRSGAAFPNPDLPDGETAFWELESEWVASFQGTNVFPSEQIVVPC